MTADLADLGATEAVRRLSDGEISALDMVEACLARIDAVDGQIEAWTHLDADYARQQAEARDGLRQAGGDLGPLHGVPVGIKDIFDTAALPTENGSVLDAGRRPEADCRVVDLLVEAGAVIMGKTVTTEFAVFSPGKTRNPHNTDHTPGGSSSGSAAAVAAGMVPLASGTQTNGSMIRPASFCGTVGYKPTKGSISRHGVLLLSRQLDTVGIFARSIADAALMGDVLGAYDSQDPDMRRAGRPRLADTAASVPPLDPTLAFVRSPVWKEATADCQGAFAEVVEVLGDSCDTVDLPAPFDEAITHHRTIMNADLATNLSAYYDRGADRISDILRGMIEDGQKTLAVDYNRAIAWVEVLNAGLDRIFDRYDAILTPAATGEAPIGLDATGSPVFCSLWTLCGTPAVSVPLLQGSEGLPIGIQLVGRRGDDARLLRTANWLVRRLAEPDGGTSE